MKKFIKTLFLAICTMCLCVLTSSVAFASESEPVEETQVVEVESAETIDENGLVDKIKDTVSGLLNEDNYFNNNILPLIISAASTLLAGLTLLIPYLRNSGKYKQLQAIYTRLKAENDNLQTLLNSTDITTIKDALALMMTEELTKAVKELKIDSTAYANFETQLKVLSAQVQALINGATNAWAQSPSAVQCLTVSPTEEAVKRQALEIKALEDYIRETKGDEAEAIILELKGENKAEV